MKRVMCLLVILSCFMITLTGCSIFCMNSCDDEEEECTEECSSSDLPCIEECKRICEACKDDCEKIWNQNSDDSSSDESTQVSGGDGQAGGYIFYDDEADGIDDIPGYRFLEAAPADICINSSCRLSWGPVGQDENGEDSTLPPELSGLGEGLTNTKWIIENRNSSDYPAFSACVEYSYGGYSDWYLPSTQELLLMKKNLYMKEIGNLSYGSYWSSTEYEDDYATSVYIFYGEEERMSHSFKENTNRVRPIRAYK